MPCSRRSKLSFSQSPCLRFKISDLQLYNPEHIPDHEWRRRWEKNALNQTKHRETATTKAIRIPEGLSSKSIELQMREIAMLKHGAAEVMGGNEGKGATLMPGYALVNFNNAQTVLAKYIPQIVGFALRRFSGPSNELLKMTYFRGCQILKGSSELSRSSGLNRWSIPILDSCAATEKACLCNQRMDP